MTKISSHSLNETGTASLEASGEDENKKGTSASESRWRFEDQANSDREPNTRTHAAKSQKSQPWQKCLLPDALDHVRDSPRFNFQQSARRLPQHFLGETSISDLLLSHTVTEADREPFYYLELLCMFRHRLRLVALLGLLLLPIFHLFYVYISPQIAQQTRVTHILMAGVCTVYLFLPAHITSLVWARLYTVFGYALMCMGTSLVMVILSKNQFEHSSLTGLQLAMLAAHSQILISVVLLPLTLWESMVMSIIVTISLAWSSWWTVQFDSGTVQTSQLFVLATTAILVLCVAHFQTILRRRAFDASFGLAFSVAKMQTLSILDAVTGGYNRLYLERSLALEINRTARFSRPLSVVMFDLDNFKSINDTRGHTVGDEVLRVVSQAAGLAVRDVDMLARYGGDEFMVVLPETEADDALTVAQRLQALVHDQLQSSFGAHTPEGQVTLSIGIVTLHLSTPTTTESVIARVDERLYEAKRMGKNRVAS